MEAISLSLSATNPEISVEEADLVDSKSIFRNSWGRRSLNGKPKEALTNDSPKDAIMADGLTPLVDWIYFHEKSEQDSDREDDCPTFHLSAVDKKRICKPWQNAFICKISGKRVGYKFQVSRLEQLWKLKQPVTLADTGNNYYVARLIHVR